MADRGGVPEKISQSDYLNLVMERNNKPKKQSSRVLEGKEQASLISNFRWEYPDYADFLIHIPNGGSRKSAVEGAILKRQGVKAGVSDLFLSLPSIMDGRLYHGLWLEFKATPPNDARVSREQQHWLDIVEKVGYAAHVGLGMDAGLNIIRDYMSGVKVFQDGGIGALKNEVNCDN